MVVPVRSAAAVSLSYYAYRYFYDVSTPFLISSVHTSNQFYIYGAGAAGEVFRDTLIIDTPFRHGPASRHTGSINTKFWRSNYKESHNNLTYDVELQGSLPLKHTHTQNDHETSQLLQIYNTHTMADILGEE